MSKGDAAFAKPPNGVGGVGAVRAAAESGATGRLAKPEVPFQHVAGYVVRGTDESSFVRCGAARVYYTRLAPQAQGELVQRYRFNAPRVLSPVYFEVSARFLDDTVVVGDNVYTAVAEINRVYPATPDVRPACARPGRGSLIAPAKASGGK